MALYLIGSVTRLAENPNDKLLPSATLIATAVDRMAFTGDKRGGNYLLWEETGPSLRHLGIGITPVLARDLEQLAREIPPELLIKMQTLGAGTWTLILRVVLPRLGSAWLFLIAAEAIASTDGLGYRIFLVRCYMTVDVILPYVAWITLHAWLMGLRQLGAAAFPWFEGVKA